MDSRLYRPMSAERLKRYLAIWRDFGDRLGRIVDSDPSRFLKPETKQKIQLLRDVTLEAMRELRRSDV